MHEWTLLKLYLWNFKNYREAQFDFSSRINFIGGANGAGKTNILDAIYYLSTGKSYFNPSDSHSVFHGENSMSIKGEYLHDNLKEGIHLAWEGRKVLKRNDEKYKRLMDHVGLIPVVMISPADRDLIIEGSEARRKFLDSTLSQTDTLYLDNLVRYHSLLKQRNAALRNGVSDPGLLEVYDIQMAETGALLSRKRAEFCQQFAHSVAQHYAAISDSAENVSLNYATKVDPEKYLEQLQSRIAKDRAIEHTTFGIHRDDLELLMEDKSIKRFGSQGQQKTFSIALKLAQYDYLYASKGFKPILLLDDIFDKLDARRVQQMVENVSRGSFGQVFITDTHPERVQQLEKGINEEINTILLEAKTVLP
jgi:DNA replication and repair protein RecF